jgi:L-seryl-tRNA(Ser) seleniumtransferase
LKVHRSNFRLEGFTAEASTGELAALAKKARVPLLYDLGGGLLTDLSDVGLTGEPTLQDAVRSGATAVIASGDKLLGGPQAGLLLGTPAFLAACRAHPLARVVRADKLTLAALAATLECYRDPATVRQAVPALRMLTAPLDVLEARAQALRALLPPEARAAVVSTRATVGGGAFPGVELQSHGVALAPEGITARVLAQRLRGGPVPVISVVQDGRVTLDVRTLLGDDSTIALAVSEALRT